MPPKKTVPEMQAIAKRMRREIIEMIGAAKSGHPGGSLSAVELVVTLYFDVMRHDPSNPKWPDRDRFILSKGHAAPVLYAAMAECGYTPKDKLNTLRKLGSIYQGHPDVRFIPALEASTGSLGEGLSLGIGMALAAKMDQRSSRTYVVLGDGEIQEGQIWEAAMFGGDKHVDNVVAIVDYNHIQLDGFVDEIMPLEPLVDKWRAFNWHVVELDGHSVWALQAGFAKEFPERFIECGIAEADMIAIAAGLASSGKIPFPASFSCFAINKGFEQLRVTVAFPNVNVKIVGTHSGISIGEDGPSQMSIEEIGLACSLPGFVVLSPADEVSMRALIHASAEHVGPVFVRAGRMK